MSEHSTATSASSATAAPAGYTRVCRLDELPEVGAAAAQIHGRRVAMVRDEDGGVHAVDDTCSHANVSLSEGEVDDCQIECWLHGSRFDLRDGHPTGPPATVPIAVYPVHLDGDEVWVAVPTDDSHTESES